tara:strand:+ start:1604 stop:2035 length:432 start_codon:yes stop_codon:yes gene_type:complete
MATEDIDIIKKNLIDCVEIELPYKFTNNDHIKYITLKGESELFYNGGKFVKYGNESIILSNGGKQWSFKTKVRNNDNYIIYNSRIFIEKNKINTLNLDIDIKQLKDTITTQQIVIEKMTTIINTLNKENLKYKNVINKLKQIN